MQGKKKNQDFYYFKHCLTILALGLTVQNDETSTISQDNGSRSVFKPDFSRERRVDLAPTHITLKRCNLKSQLVTCCSIGPQSLVSHALSWPLFFLLLTWEFSFVPYPWNKRNKPRDSLSESSVYIPPEVCLESRMLIKQFFTHWWSFSSCTFSFL